MIIHVVPEKWYKEYIPAGEKLPVYQNPGSPFWKNGNFIIILNINQIFSADEIINLTEITQSLNETPAEE